MARAVVTLGNRNKNTNLIKHGKQHAYWAKVIKC
jgi:hypothetical protein